MLTLRFGLAGSEGDVFLTTTTVSDPSDPRYGQHLSKEEVERLVIPTGDARHLVREWLLDHGIEEHRCQYSPARDWITVTLPVSAVERLLDTTYSVYEHEDGSRLVRTTSWSLPLSLHEHITTIQPTTVFLRPKIQGETVLEVPGNFRIPDALPENATGIAAVCNFSAVTTTCLRTLYNTVNYVPQVPGKNRIGFTNYLGQVDNRSDTAIFLQHFRPDAAEAAYDYLQVSIDGGKIDNGTGGAGIEANLDVQTILGITYPSSVTSYHTGGEPPFHPDDNTPLNTNEPYLTWVNYVLNQTTLPQVISTSYGDDEQTVPYSYALTVCNQFAQLGVRGVSLLFSSGDSGVGANDSCVTNDGTNTSTFLPAFPASCPYVTAVGGTRSYPEVVAFDPRNGYASGSGFSNYFARPKYQDKVVKEYIEGLQGEYDGWYNKSGRAYPDIAAQSYQFLIIIAARIRSVDGTSCAAPTASGVISLVNDALLAVGKAPLGWLNPWLYKKGYKAFTDVTEGSSIGCNVTGFTARPGWDVASGFGTPDFEALLDVVGLGS